MNRTAVAKACWCRCGLLKPQWKPKMHILIPTLELGRWVQMAKREIAPEFPQIIGWWPAIPDWA